MLLIKTSRESLLGPLQAVAGIVERRHTLPILSNVLIEKRGSALTFLATDIEIQVRTSAPASGGEDGSVTVGARKFQDILRSLADGCEVSVSIEDKRLQIRSGKSRFNLQTLPADDFPRMSLNRDQVRRIELSQKALRSLFAQTQYAMASQDVRYYLNGLLLLVEERALKAVATDGHRLAYASLEANVEGERQEVILPRKTVLELNRLLADVDEPVVIEMGTAQVRFLFGDVELVSKIIDGKFPDYGRVIPTVSRNVLTIERAPLQQAMSRAAILSNEKFRGVRLVLGENVLRLVAANAEQEEAQEEIEVTYSGEALDIGFNVGYLLDVMANVGSEKLQWMFNDANSSALMMIPGNDAFKYVVMPMRI